MLKRQRDVTPASGSPVFPRRESTYESGAPLAAETRARCIESVASVV
jgi:hypothetical protein